jgi:hypothetical protein
MVRPYAVLRTLAILFLIAPFGNLFLSLAFSGVDGWWRPAITGELLTQVSVLDWLELTLIFLSGILLLVRHKTAWLVAVLTMFIAIALSVSSVLDSDPVSALSAASEIQIFFSVFMSCCVLIVLFYARYPYLDRRQGWLRPAADRFDVRTIAHLTAGAMYQGQSESLSNTGCRLRLNQEWPPQERLRFVDLQFPEFGSVRIKAQVVGVDGAIVRLKFREFTEGDRKAFQQWVEERALDQT